MIHAHVAPVAESTNAEGVTEGVINTESGAAVAAFPIAEFAVTGFEVVESRGATCKAFDPSGEAIGFEVLLGEGGVFCEVETIAREGNGCRRIICIDHTEAANRSLLKNGVDEIVLIFLKRLATSGNGISGKDDES